MWRKSESRRCSLRGKGYLFVEGFVVLACVGVTIAVNALGKPLHQGFFCDDRSIDYPYKPDTVSSEFIVGFTIGVPILLIVLVEFIWRIPGGYVSTECTLGNGQPGHVWTVLRNIVTYFYGFVMLTLMVVVLKLTTGQFRPHFLAVCRPDINLTTCHGYVSDYNCTNVEEKELVAAARMSFPSGHTANAVFMALFLVFYLDFRTRTRPAFVCKMLVYGSLILYAVWCSVTRITDHMHHAGDVVAGSVLGAVVAGITFYRGVLHDMRYKGGWKPNDVESGRANGNANDNNNNKNDDEDAGDAGNGGDDDDDDDDDDNLEKLETETPSTPTPLLFNGVAVSSSSGMRIGPLRLEGDKRKFSRRATLQ